MLRCPTIVLAVCVAAIAGCKLPGGAPLRGVALQAVRKLPHDDAAYTQGLIFRDGVFFESTGLYGSSTLRKVSIESGEVLVQRELRNRYFAEGLVALGELLYQLSWREATGFVYREADLELVGTFSYAGEGWGLTTDGTHLIMSDGTYALRFLDPASFDVVRTIEVRDEGGVVFALNELEWVDGEIWANIWQQDNIARIDPNTGTVLGWVNVGGLISSWDRWRGAEVANGIAYDSISGRLWVTGKYWPSVFEVEVPESAAAAGSLGI